MIEERPFLIAAIRFLIESIPFLIEAVTVLIGAFRFLKGAKRVLEEAVAVVMQASAFLNEAIRFSVEAVRVVIEALRFSKEAIAFLAARHTIAFAVLNQSEFSENAMNNAIPSPVPAEMHPSLDNLAFAIGTPLRWQILGELAAGEPLLVVEIAGRLKRSPGLISKHIGVLRKMGLVSANRAGQYHIQPQFVVSAADRCVDFGHCLLRLPGAKVE